MKFPTQTHSRRRALGAALGLAATGGVVQLSSGQDDPAPTDEAQPRGIRKGRVKQSACHWCFGGPLEDLAKYAAELGMSGIDVVAPKDWPTLKKHGLVSTMTPTFERGLNIGNNINQKKNHEVSNEVLRARIDECAAAGFTNVLVFSGNRMDGLSDREGMDNCAEALRQVAPYAEEKGVVLMMELLNSKRDHKGYMCDRTHWGAELCQKVGSDAFKLLYDIYHMQVQEGDVIATIREHHQVIGHYHTAGVPGRNEIDETQELYYPAVMHAVLETGFQGVVGQEFIPKREKFESLAQAVRICDV